MGSGKWSGFDRFLPISREPISETPLQDADASKLSEAEIGSGRSLTEPEVNPPVFSGVLSCRNANSWVRSRQ